MNAYHVEKHHTTKSSYIYVPYNIISYQNCSTDLSWKITIQLPSKITLIQKCKMLF
jgi:hypothetical protein